MNRPDRLNAVSLPLYRALGGALEALADEPAVRAVVLTGTGRAFCSGADMKAHGERDRTSEERRSYIAAGQAVHRRLQTLLKPTIAAVNGPAVGAGLELALSCDFILVADDARLRLPELTLGTFVGGGTLYTLPRRVGLARAKELIMVGDFFSGREAVEMGLASRSLSADRVLDEALRLAEELASRAPIPMAHAKALLDRAGQLDAQTALELEAEALLSCMESRDWEEGVRAFTEGRTPHFRGE